MVFIWIEAGLCSRCVFQRFLWGKSGAEPKHHQWQLRGGRTNMALGRLERGVVELVKFAALETKEVVIIGGG